MSGQEHKHKSWPAFFEPVLSGEKTLEVRRDDRDFQVGDHVVLQEWDPLSQDYTGRELHVDITYVWGCDDRIPGTQFEKPGDEFPVIRGYCVFGFHKSVPVEVRAVDGAGVEGAPV
jgi:hypothetical protein